ncbi:MAG: glycosyltransferase family 4 protein [Acidimicrobiales bacterium]
MRHLLVTNDFPPKTGGIQSYLWELWRRLPPDRFGVLTTARQGSDAFDSSQAFPVERVRARMLLPGRDLLCRVRAAAERLGAGLVVLDPALPLGALGPRLGIPYAVVVHGAEISVPGRIPGLGHVLGGVLSGARVVIAAGSWPAAEAQRSAGGRIRRLVRIPPGVDAGRFRPLDVQERLAARRRLGLGGGRLVVSVSRLVPRKGMDVLVDAAALLARGRPDLSVAIGGEGRDRARLDRRVRRQGAPVRLLGRVADSDLPDLYGSADVFAMACRSRWGGLEQEGFGIVFLEAAACGVPQVAGRSGGSDEAVEDGVTGLVVRRPADPACLAASLARLLDEPQLRASMGDAARRRAERHFDCSSLAQRLGSALDGGACEAEGSSPPW